MQLLDEAAGCGLAIQLASFLSQLKVSGEIRSAFTYAG